MYCRTWRPGAAGTSLGLKWPGAKAAARDLVLVPVAIVDGVAVAIVLVVHVVIVWHSDVSAIWAVLVLVGFVWLVLLVFALVPVAFVLAVQVAVVHVVDVIIVWDSNVTAVWAVLVGVLFVDCVSHFLTSLPPRFQYIFIKHHCRWIFNKRMLMKMTPFTA